MLLKRKKLLVLKVAHLVLTIFPVVSSLAPQQQLLEVEDRIRVLRRSVAEDARTEPALSGTLFAKQPQGTSNNTTTTTTNLTKTTRIVGGTTASEGSFFNSSVGCGLVTRFTYF